MAFALSPHKPMPRRRCVSLQARPWCTPLDPLMALLHLYLPCSTVSIQCCGDTEEHVKLIPRCAQVCPGVRFARHALGLGSRLTGGVCRALRPHARCSDNARLASCGAERTILLWDVVSGRVIRRFRGHEPEVPSAPTLHSSISQP